MPDNTGFTFDFTEFNRRFLEYATKTAPAAAEEGLWVALNELKRDCDSVVPKTPLREGNLRGDWTRELAGITQSKVDKTGSKGASPKPAERFGAKDIIARIIFRMPYAARWHEAAGKKINWTESGAGPKYVESKLSMFRRKYMNIVAEFIKKATG